MISIFSFSSFIPRFYFNLILIRTSFQFPFWYIACYQRKISSGKISTVNIEIYIHLSSHSLTIETGRYNDTHRALRIVTDYFEDEIHFIIECPVLSTIKNMLKNISTKNHRCSNLLQLFYIENFKDTFNLVTYISFSVKLGSNICH